uniref:Cdc23 domain-containing protein n=1 Tax=Glossina palpalis gambiensis TaxID=67801 RepID=A0A1B0BLD2_9MUSC
MEDDFFNVPDAKRELRQGIVECQKRGVVYSVKWLAEICHGLAGVDIDGEDERDNFDIRLESKAPKEYDNYFLGKSNFDVREYYRAAHLGRNVSSPVFRFLHLYATFMAAEKRRLDSATDQSNLNDSSHFKDLVLTSSPKNSGWACLKSKGVKEDVPWSALKG